MSKSVYLNTTERFEFQTIAMELLNDTVIYYKKLENELSYLKGKMNNKEKTRCKTEKDLDLLRNILVDLRGLKEQSQQLLDGLSADCRFTFVISNCRDFLDGYTQTLVNTENELQCLGCEHSIINSDSMLVEQEQDDQDQDAVGDLQNVQSSVIDCGTSAVCTSQAQFLNSPASPPMPSMTDFGISAATLGRLTDYKEIFVEHQNPLTSLSLPSYTSHAHHLNVLASPRVPSMTDFGISEATLGRLADFKQSHMENQIL